MNFRHACLYYTVRSIVFWSESGESLEYKFVHTDLWQEVIMGVWVAVKWRGISLSTKTAYQVDPSAMFGDLSARVLDIKEDENISHVQIKGTDGKFKMNVDLDTPVVICTQFSAFSIEFIIEAPEKMVQDPEKNYMTVLMGSAKNRYTPNKVKENNNYDKLFNLLIAYLKGDEVNWSPTIVSLTGDKFVKSLLGLLWHITCHYDCFLERAAVLPSFITNLFANHNDHTKKQKSKPQLFQTKLKTYIDV